MDEMASTSISEALITEASRSASSSGSSKVLTLELAVRVGERARSEAEARKEAEESRSSESSVSLPAWTAADDFASPGPDWEGPSDGEALPVGGGGEGARAVS